MSIRTRLLIELAALVVIPMIAITGAVTASMLALSHNSQSQTGQALMSEAQARFVQANRLEAQHIDQALAQAEQAAQQFASYASAVFDPNRPDQHPESSVEQELIIGPDGQRYSDPSGLSGIFVPTTAHWNNAVLAEIKRSSDLDLIWKPVQENNPMIRSLYLATTSRVFRVFPNRDLAALQADFNPTIQDWYVANLPGNNPDHLARWMLSQSEAGGGATGTISVPIYTGKDEFYGVAAVDLTLDSILSSVESVQILPGSYSFLIDNQGRALALPEQGYQDWLGRQAEAGEFGADLTTLNDSFTPLFARLLTGETGFETIETGGRRLVVAFTPLESNHWRLASAIDGPRLLEGSQPFLETISQAAVRQMVSRVFPIILVILALALLIVVLLVQSISRPIRALASVAGQIVAGEWRAIIPHTRRDEIGDLENLVENLRNRLHTLTWELEKQVAERTQFLQRRVVRLQAAAEVGHTAATLQNQDQLLDQVTHLISEHFGFYHVGLFLLDETGENAVLRAANSEGGQAMLECGYQLRAGQGIVGCVAESGKARIALDTGRDAVHFQNQYLPETRSEMALPLTAGGQLLGVLDVQSKIESAFSPEDIQILQVLADQVSIAIQNARLFQALQNTLRETGSLSGHYIQKEWSQRVASDSLLAYQYDRTATAASQPYPLSPVEISRLQSGQMVTINNTTAPDGRPVALLLAPIILLGQAIGVVGFEEDDPGHTWTAEDNAMIESVCGQVALSMENIRLLEEANERAARERLVSEVTSRIRETLDLDTVLQTAALEIRKHMNLHDVTIQLGEMEAGANTAEMADSGENPHAWARLLNSHPHVGYRAEGCGLVALSGAAVPLASAQSLPELQLPIQLRGQTLGMVELHKPAEAGDWTQSERELVQKLVEQLSAALESARLYEDTRRQAERERLAGEIVGKIRSSNQPETILRVATEELSRALRASRAQVHIHPAPPAEEGAGNGKIQHHS